MHSESGVVTQEQVHARGKTFLQADFTLPIEMLYVPVLGN